MQTCQWLCCAVHALQASLVGLKKRSPPRYMCQCLNTQQSLHADVFSIDLQGCSVPSVGASIVTLY